MVTGSRRRIPTRIVVTGDVEAGKKLIGFAEVKTDELEHEMSRQSLKQNTRRITLPGGITIECISRFSLREIRIYVPEEGMEPEVKKDLECFCSCYFAVGRIVAFTVQDPPAEHNDENVMFDVKVCQHKRRYVLFRNCVPTDFAQYEVAEVSESGGNLGELVVVFLQELPVEICCDESETFDETYACDKEDEAPGPDDTTTVIFRVAPLFIQGLMQWEEVD